MRYIEMVRMEAQKFGACKVVPPAGWRGGKLALPPDLPFEPRLMPLHKLQQGCGFQMAPPTTLAKFAVQAAELKTVRGTTAPSSPCATGSHAARHQMNAPSTWGVGLSPRLPPRAHPRAHPRLSLDARAQAFCVSHGVREFPAAREGGGGDPPHETDTESLPLVDAEAAHVDDSRTGGPLADPDATPTAKAPALPHGAGMPAVDLTGDDDDDDLDGMVVEASAVPIESKEDGEGKTPRHRSSTGATSPTAPPVVSTTPSSSRKSGGGADAEDGDTAATRQRAGTKDAPVDKVDAEALSAAQTKVDRAAEVAAEAVSMSAEGGRSLIEWLLGSNLDGEADGEGPCEGYHGECGGRRVSDEQLAHEEELERCFWRLVRTESEPLIVPYGADLDTTTHGSGFQPHEAGAWNLNRLATARGSLLDDQIDVPGVSSPWLYVGGLFSAFCWHTEDLWMYSCNHLHAGATKTWYVVPAAAALKFEKATRAMLPALFEHAPDLLYQLVAMVAPADLVAQGVPVYQLQQRAGEFIVTCPRAYHAGFSHGLNVAEAVNFATADWLPFGRNAMACYSQHRRTPVFSMERLLCRLSLLESPPISLSTADWLLPELQAVIADELDQRKALPHGSTHLITLGHSPRDTAAALRIDPGSKLPGGRYGGRRDATACRHAPPAALFPPAVRAELAELGRATGGFRAFDEDLLTCVECNRVLFLSGVTDVRRRRPAAAAAAAATTAATAATAASGSEAGAGSRGSDEQPPVPLSACLRHASHLSRACAASIDPTPSAGELVGGDASGDGAEVERRSLAPGFVAWQRFDSTVLTSMSTQLEARLPTRTERPVANAPSPSAKA